MKHLRIILLFICLSAVSATQAEIIVLQSGQQINGKIELQNDQIIRILDNEGRRFQYPRSEVIQIIQPVENVEQEVVEDVQQEVKGNCALRLDLSGGGLFVPTLCNGGYGAAAIQIGTRRIGNKSVFLGGSVGYQAAVGKQLYNFLPIMAVVSFPLIEGKHAPEIGAALGYGFALKNPNKGGMVAKMDISWRYQYTNKSALLLGIQASFQQAQVSFVENITDIDEDGKIYNKDFTSVLGKTFVGLGVRMAFQF